MGERSYAVESYEGVLHHLRFSEDDDDWGCLCTFPHNDRAEGRIMPGHMRALALLGAAVVLAIWDTEELGPDGLGDAGELGTHVHLPNAVPQWIRDEIQRALPVERLDA